MYWITKAILNLICADIFYLCGGRNGPVTLATYSLMFDCRMFVLNGSGCTDGH